MELSDLMIEKIKKRATDSIALLNFQNNFKHDRLRYEKWLAEFYTIDSEFYDVIINEIYKQTGIAVRKAVINEIDFIQIPALGSLRLNPARREIIQTIHESEEPLEQEDITKIIQKHFEAKQASKQDVYIDIKVL